jgi:hypothetical protein
VKKIVTAERGSSASKAQKDAGKATSKKPVDLKLFAAAAASKLREIGVIKEDEEYEQHPALKEAVELFEIANFKMVNSYDNAVEASAAFNNYIDSVGYEYVEPVLYRLDGFTIGVSVPTKSGTLSLSADIIPLTDDHAAAISAAKKMMRDLFNGAFANGVTRTLPETTKPAGKKTYETDEKEISILRVGTYNNKTVYHCIPVEGKWIQFGIPLYPDVAKAEGIELPEEEGEYDVAWNATYELKDDGKPRRIISLTDV